MVGRSAQHAAVLGELVEWWQDLSRQEINSRAVLLPLPPGWGRTHLLSQFAALVEADEALSIGVPIQGASLPDGLGLQALALRDLFGGARMDHRVAEVLGVDRLGGVVQLGLSVGGLLSDAASRAGRAACRQCRGGGCRQGVGHQPDWARRHGRQTGSGGRGRVVHAVQVVTIDDADRLQPDLAVILVENLIERIDGRVLVVAVVNPGGELVSALTSRATYGLTEGRVRIVDVDFSLGYQARVELATELCPDLPVAAVRRIGERTQTFAEVFAVTSAERLSELDADGDDAATTRAVDEVIDAQVDRAPPSAEAVVLA